MRHVLLIPYGSVGEADHKIPSPLLFAFKRMADSLARTSMAHEPTLIQVKPSQRGDYIAKIVARGFPDRTVHVFSARALEMAYENVGAYMRAQTVVVISDIEFAEDLRRTFLCDVQKRDIARKEIPPLTVGKALHLDCQSFIAKHVGT